VDLEFAIMLGAGSEVTELFQNLIGFEVDAFDRVIETTTFDRGPIHNGGRGCAERVAQLGLLKDFFGTGASAAIGKKLFRSELSAFHAIDNVEEAQIDGVGHGDAKIEIPGRVDS